MADGLYWKVPFVLSGTVAPPPPPPSPPPPGDEDGGGPVIGWRTLNPAGEDLELVGACLAASVDGWDVSAVRQLGATATAALVLADSPGYSSEPSWWEVLTVDGIAAGFVLPVRFDNAALDGLDEATIFHVGVLPEFRGRGLARHLLRRAMSTLLRQGVWRIYCDTAANNEPMLYLFESEGWTRLEAHERPTYAAD
jgi:ribosomal protein S18 acetylase RimI-like enzyme